MDVTEEASVAAAFEQVKSQLDAPSVFIYNAGFVKSLALELGEYGIRVNAIAPGLTATDATSFIPQDSKDNVAQMTPLRRIGQAEDVAGAILLLASEEARFITGSYLMVNGGLQML